MILRSAIAAGLILIGPAFASDAPSEPVVRAEREFAAYAARHGFRAGVLRYAHPDALGFEQGPVRARELAERRPEPPNAPKLFWWPIWAGVSRSGDLGFTSGPYVVGDDLAHGHYFTVWRRGPDGSWRWIYDGGPRSKGRSPFSEETPVAAVPASAAGLGSAETAMAAVERLEAELARAALVDTERAYRSVLATDGRLMGSPAEPGAGPASATAELAWRGAMLEMAPLGGEASAAGDMVFTYGRAAWAGAGPKPARGHYVRIWQAREAGWRLLADVLLPAPPGPQQASASQPTPEG